MAAHTNYRAIIRISYDGDNVPTAAVRNSVASRLEDAGFTRNGTGAFETASSNIIAIQTQLSAALEDIAHISANEDHSTSLDHIWIYMDKV